MKPFFANTSPAFALAALVFTSAAAAPAAEPAPKLTHRPLPGLTQALSKRTGAPKIVARKAPPPGTVAAATAERARIVFIHRREKLPESMTKDLAPNKDVSDEGTRRRAVESERNAAPREGRVKIIPKAEVASLLAAQAPELAGPPKP